MKFEIKADKIISELLAAQAAAEEAKEKAKLKVPVSMKGRIVGFGTLNLDGSMTIKTEKSPEGEELRKLILNAAADHISVGFSIKPPTV